MVAMRGRDRGVDPKFKAISHAQATSWGNAGIISAPTGAKPPNSRTFNPRAIQPCADVVHLAIVRNKLTSESSAAITVYAKLFIPDFQRQCIVARMPQVATTAIRNCLSLRLDEHLPFRTPPSASTTDRRVQSDQPTLYQCSQLFTESIPFFSPTSQSHGV